MKRITKQAVAIASVIVAGSLFFASCGTTDAKKDQMASTKMEKSMKEVKAPKYVFYFIGDGMGVAQRQSAEYYAEYFLDDDDYKLQIDKLKVAGINTTHSSSSLVTDSAAAGTALATGHKTNNGMIAVTPEGDNIKTLVEAAEEKGMKTALISTTRLTHATPASFASHNISRNNENEIAADFVDSGVDFYAGGGYRYFVGKNNAEGLKSKRKDNRDIVNEFKAEGYKTFVGENESDDFMNFKPSKDDKVFAALTYSHMPYEVDRVSAGEKIPSLADLTEKGIETLKDSDTGFFMMVEGGRIDHACHAHDSLGSIGDTLAFDEAVKKAYEFYTEHPDETLIVVTADHETGGMGLGFAKNYWLNMGALDQVTVSVDDVLQKAYTGDREAFIKVLADKFGLFNLSEADMEKLNEAMDKADAGKTVYGYAPAAIEATNILSQKANMQWTTHGHTGTQVALSAEGVQADKFGGYKDNTEVAETMFDVLGLNN